MADSHPATDRTHIVAERWLLRGPVQGIGLRPRVVRLASQCQLSGQVENTAAGVEILVEGVADAVDRFADLLPSGLPTGVAAKEIRRATAHVSGTRGFHIVSGRSQGPLAVEVPPDVAICGDCLQDVATVGNRRHLYPLASCASCGPRYSIIDSMPYERAATTMNRFPLCRACALEYRSANDRRFHAQSMACADCGPRLWATDARGSHFVHGNEAIVAAVHALEQGLIVALRGIGGYQLLVDAKDRDAVRRLRTRKRRAAKPLAIMVASLDEAARVARLEDIERQVLGAPANPILVARARGESQVAPEVASGLDTLGVMLPTTALHWLILKGLGRPVVATSGNREGEPLASDVTQAEHDLLGVTDLWLHHDRPIQAAIDDSVIRVLAGRPVTLRLGRGLAPLPLDLPYNEPFVAVGAHQKAAIALSNGVQAALGPHVGDLDTVAARSRFADHYDSFLRLYATEPRGIAHDLHPSYFTTRWAETQPILRLGVQHHHAHVVSAMIEHGWLDRTVLGVAFDGTGDGGDGTMWGGEFLLATRDGFRRAGHLLPFCLPGGEAAIREPWRVAVSIVSEAVSPEAAARLEFPGVGASQVSMLARLLNSDRVSLLTSSAGRLFDAVAAIALGITHVDYEGQAAMMLEAACAASTEAAYRCALVGNEPTVVDWRPMIRELLADCAEGLAPQIIAARFHHALAQAIVAVCRRYPQFPVVLSGGVFQNRALVECVHQLFEGHGQPLGLPGRIPPNDGGLAAGQLAVALAQTSGVRGLSCV